MANELQSLSQIFQNRLFRIPDYQRGYAWQQAQLIDFWDDLVNLQKNRFHYTGLLSLKILSEKEAESWGNDLWITEKGYKPCHIVDGQQRLTTFIDRTTAAANSPNNTSLKNLTQNNYE